jgi:sporulation protein YlmC with PRC-barrel domain
MYMDELFGEEVLDTNANRIGKVADLDVDLLKGAVNHMIVKAGLTKKYVASLDMIEKIGDGIVLKVGQGEIQKK